MGLTLTFADFLWGTTAGKSEDGTKGVHLSVLDETSGINVVMGWNAQAIEILVSDMFKNGLDKDEQQTLLTRLGEL